LGVPEDGVEDPNEVSRDTALVKLLLNAFQYPHVAATLTSDRCGKSLPVCDVLRNARTAR